MSPTCTIPYEILFDFLNDTKDALTMQVLRREDGSQTGATIFIHQGESISLVLTAGTPYKYTIKQHGLQANLSVKVWQDTRYYLSSAFSASSSSNDEVHSVTESGVKVTFSSL